MGKHIWLGGRKIEHLHFHLLGRQPDLRCIGEAAWYLRQSGNSISYYPFDSGTSTEAEALLERVGSTEAVKMKHIWLGGATVTPEHYRRLGCPVVEDNLYKPAWYVRSTEDGGSRISPTDHYTEDRAREMLNSVGSIEVKEKQMNIKTVATSLRQKVKPYEKYIIAAAALIAIDYFFFGGAGSERIRRIAGKTADRLTSMIDGFIDKIGG